MLGLCWRWPAAAAARGAPSGCWCRRRAATPPTCSPRLAARYPKQSARRPCSERTTTACCAQRPRISTTKVRLRITQAAAAPALLPEFYVGELSQIFILAIAGVGLMLLIGYTGGRMVYGVRGGVVGAAACAFEHVS